MPVYNDDIIPKEDSKIHVGQSLKRFQSGYFTRVAVSPDTDLGMLPLADMTSVSFIIAPRSLIAGDDWTYIYNTDPANTGGRGIGMWGSGIIALNRSGGNESILTLESDQIQTAWLDSGTIGGAQPTLRFGDPTSGTKSLDTVVTRDGIGILALKNGSAVQALRIYGDATNHISLSHNGTNGVVTLALATSDPHMINQLWANSGVVTVSAGVRASINIVGLAATGSMTVTADVFGPTGNGYTVSFVSPAPTHNVALSAAIVSGAVTVTLGTDNAGVLDATKNTVTLVTAAVDALVGVSAVVVDSGADTFGTANITASPYDLTGGQ
jgi:hypothetical protein